MIENVDVEKTCRICAEKFDMVLNPIFVSNNIDVLKMLEGLNIKISENDGLPNGYCNSCSEELTQVYTFILKCVRSEKILRNQLQTMPNKKTENHADEVNELNCNDRLLKKTKFSSNKDDCTIKGECSTFLNDCDKSTEIVFKTIESSKMFKDKTKFQKKRHKRKSINKEDKTKNDSKSENFERNYIEENCDLKKSNSFSRRNYKCCACSIVFDNFSSYQQHKKEKHPSNSLSYLCDVCGKEFNKRDRLLQHKNRHIGLKPYKCDICEKTFAIKGSLRSHYQKHIKPENFKCDVCGKNFIIRKCYEDHVKRHNNGEKLFKCPYCPRTFKLLSTLTHHCTFHNKTLDKKYHCNECDTNFRRSDHLKEHINGVHLKILPFKCELCSQAFVTGAKRNIHVKRMHSGKRYQCNQCEKDFSLPSSLNRHKKSHSGIKSLICEICNESFVTPPQIEKHMETHQLDEMAKNNLITQTYEKIKQIAINQEEIIEC